MNMMSYLNGTLAILTDEVRNFIVSRRLGVKDLEQPEFIRVFVPLMFIFEGAIFLRWYADKINAQFNFPLTIGLDHWHAKEACDPMKADVMHIGSMETSLGLINRKEDDHILRYYRWSPGTFLIKGEADTPFILEVETIRSPEAGLLGPKKFLQEEKVVNY